MRSPIIIADGNQDHSLVGLAPTQAVSPELRLWQMALICLAVSIAAMANPLAAQGQSDRAPVPSTTGNSTGHRLHIVAKSPGKARRRVSSGATAPTCVDGLGNPGVCSVQYYGGQIISNADVVVVYWGSGVSSVVDCGGGTNPCIGVSQFFDALANSTFTDMLEEYNTAGVNATAGSKIGQPGTSQVVGRGTLHAGSPFAITVTAPNSGSTIGDSNVQNEIQVQIAAGTLPAPATGNTGNVNTLYMVYFPPGIVISDPGAVSCVDYCAYHSTYNLNALDVPYGVVPDYGNGSGCDVGCGAGTEWQNITDTSSHEFAESITDAAVGIGGPTIDYPLAWYDANNGEIGDPCSQTSDTLLFDSISYTVQQILSQKAYNLDPNGGCVSPPTLTFTLTAPSSSSPGTPFDVTVTVANSDASTYQGSVHFTSSDSSASLPADYSFTVADAGSHTFANGVTLNASGADTVTVADAHQSGNAGTATVSVRKATTTSLSSAPNPSVYGQQVTFTAVVTGASGIPTGLVTMNDGAITLGTGTLSGGVATFTISGLAVGSHSITASYGGDTNYNASSSSALIQSVKADTTVTLASSTNPSVFNQSVTFTADVTSTASGTPTGTITFFDGANSLGTGALSSGVAAFSISALAVGSHSITASYSGDSTFNSSTSSPVTQAVNQASTTVQLGSNLNPSGFGLSVTFTATVVPQFSGLPTGVVTFLDGTTSIASIGVTNSRAVFSTSALAVGTHSITASYNGDSNFSGNTSNALSQVVNSSIPFTTLVSFAGTNGSGPYAGLVQGSDGNFYGTANYGANNSCAGGCGTVFRVTSGGILKTLHNFSGLDGSAPAAPLVQAFNGTFYGTTASGGGNNCYGGCGTVFKITAGGTLTTLYFFAGPEGAQPEGLVQATNGSFYGTTHSGGAPNDSGTVFKITAAGAHTTLYTFCSQANCADGSYPKGELVQASDGNFYGTTSFGGAHSAGTVFKITAAGKLTTLYNFCATYNSQGYCSDGLEPSAGLVQGTDGNFYGTTSGDGDNGTGTVFKMTAGGTLTTLHSFGLNSTDGGKPNAALIQATDGNFYGVTDAFGAKGDGTIFEITPGGTETTLYSFTAASFLRTQALVQATDGNFYGTTDGGGTKGNGTVYRLITGLGPFVETQPTSGKVGASVKILGTNLTGATSLSFNGTPATFTVVSSSEITTTVPAGATTGTVQVATPGGTLTSNIVFQVTPVITGFTPPSGLVGTQVTINGVSLTQTSKVTFGGVNATAFTVNSDTQVTASVPKGARTGRIAITTPGGTATSATSFTVTP